MHLFLKRFNHIIRKGLILISLSVPLIINAQGVDIGPVISKNNIVELITAVIDFIFYVTLPITGIMILVAAFFFITAAGEPEKINAAKKLIIYAVIGLFIVFLAKAFVITFTAIIGVNVGP